MIHHRTDQYIFIDLDDGVKMNYEIFKEFEGSNRRFDQALCTGWNN